MKERPPTDGDIDTRVREALARGDRREALRLTMEAHGAAVFRYCVHQLGDSDSAADIRQTTFVEAYRDLPRFEWRSTLLTWLLGIARHRCMDSVKVKSRWDRRAAPLEAVAETAGTDPDPVEQLAQESLVDALRRCIALLGEKAREAVALRYQEGLSYVEIAEICGDRAPTLQARVARALPVLRRCLEERGVTP